MPPTEVVATIDGADLPARSMPAAMLPDEVTSFGCLSSGEWLYVLGGYSGVPHRYSSEFQSQAFRRLNLRNGSTWEELPNDLRAQSVELVAHANRLYRVGGMMAKNRADEPAHLVSLAKFASFDPDQPAWRAEPPLPSPRSSHAAAVVNGTLYVVGG